MGDHTFHQVSTIIKNNSLFAKFMVNNNKVDILKDIRNMYIKHSFHNAYGHCETTDFEDKITFTLFFTIKSRSR